MRLSFSEVESTLLASALGTIVLTLNILKGSLFTPILIGAYIGEFMSCKKTSVSAHAKNGEIIIKIPREIKISRIRTKCFILRAYISFRIFAIFMPASPMPKGLTVLAFS